MAALKVCWALLFSINISQIITFILSSEDVTNSQNWITVTNLWKVISYLYTLNRF